ncbi:MAG: rod shape-determining protein MreD [Myxococcota bacterium]
MTRALRLTGLALGLLGLQALAVALLGPGPLPDPVLIFALLMGLRARGVGGLVASFALGLAVDVVSGSPLGLYAMLRGTACAATRLFDRALYVRAPLPWAIYVAAYSVLDGLLLGLALEILAPVASPVWPAHLLRLPLAALMTALLALPLLSRVGSGQAESGRESGWATLTSRAGP